MARMRYGVVLAHEAARSYRALPAYRRAEVRNALERHLRHEPARVSKSRIKRLRGLSQPQYRFRVGEVRVFYDVTREAVEVLDRHEGRSGRLARRARDAGCARRRWLTSKTICRDSCVWLNPRRYSSPATGSRLAC